MTILGFMLMTLRHVYSRVTVDLKYVCVCVCVCVCILDI